MIGCMLAPRICVIFAEALSAKETFCQAQERFLRRQNRRFFLWPSIAEKRLFKQNIAKKRKEKKDLADLLLSPFSLPDADRNQHFA